MESSIEYRARNCNKYLNILAFQKTAIIFFIVLINVQFGDNAILPETQVKKFVCHLGDSNFWKLYNWHFGNATNVKISILARKHPGFIQNYVSNILSHLFAKSKLKRTFVIKRHTILWKGNMTDTSILDNVQFTHSDSYISIRDVFIYDDYDEFVYSQKIRVYSGDPSDAYLLIVFDIEDLKLFLKTQHRKILYNPRGSYIINILTPDIQNISEEIKNTLDLLWVKYGVLNVRVQLPCSDLHYSIFSFNPFIFFNNTWGISYNFNIDDAIKNSMEYSNNLRNMQGYPVNISMFVRRPTAILSIPKSIKDIIYSKMLKKSGGYGGVDGIVLAYISEYLNFTTVINTPPSDREYGFKLNETLVGSLGDVVYHYVAASFNGRFISQYDSDDIEFTNPSSNDYLCLLVPKAEKIPQWLKISICFESQTWFGILGLYVVISIYWSMANKVTSNKDKKTVEDSFFEVLTLFISVPFRKVPFNSQKVFIGVCLMFNIIFVGTFQGSLYNSYSKESYFPDINTLEELDNTNLHILVSSKSLIGAFGTDPNPIMKRLKDKIIYLNGTSSLDKAAEDRDVAAFERKADARLRIKTEFARKSDGFELLHVMNECPWTYYVSYIVPIGSPYLPIFNFLITTFLEAGLISKWHLDTVDGLILEKRVRPTEQTLTLKPFTLEDMQAAFYLISLGLVFSFLVFVMEVLIHWCIYRLS